MNSFRPSAPDSVDTALVERVDQRTINKRDGSNTTLYEVYVVGSQTPLATFKRSLADSAFELIGQAAELHYAVKQNGDFTNYYLNNILPARATAAEAAQRAQEAQPLLRQAAGLPEAPVPSQGLTNAPSKDQAIHRQTAAKVAATLVQAAPNTDPYVFWENVEKLAHYFDTGVIPTKAGLPHLDPDEDDIPF